MLTQEHLKAVINYNQNTGKMTWRERGHEYFKGAQKHKAWNTKNSGNAVGHISKRSETRSYLNVCVFGTMYRGHRLAWLYTYGVFPSGGIDHIDGNGLNNSILNLREATSTENNRNKRIYKNNTSGHVGVVRSRKKWLAQIKVNGEKLCLGTFESKAPAIKARLIEQKRHGFHYNHGKSVNTIKASE